MRNMSNTMVLSPRAVAAEERPAVVCRQVTKDFRSGDGRVSALNGVDFEAKFGEITLLIGPSGCGKTTLLSVIGGLLDKTAGQLEVLGVDPQALKGSAGVVFRRQNLGFI